MFLRHTKRWKDGKQHLYWSIVENRRCKGGRILQKTVLYLGEINDSQKEQWIRAIEVFDENLSQSRQLKLFSHQRPLPDCAPDGIQVRLDRMEIHRPRQWGACWLFTELWKELKLDTFWRERLGTSREGTDWEHVLQLLCCYRLLEPGSEWRLHRHWFDRSAMDDLLHEDFSIAAKDTLYRCHDLLLDHKGDLFTFLRGRWEDLFGVKFDILLYDLTSTYFESDPPFPPGDKRKFGYDQFTLAWKEGGRRRTRCFACMDEAKMVGQQVTVRLINGGTEACEATRRVIDLLRYCERILPLNSPIRHPSYNGAIEHGVGSFKRAVCAALDPDLPVPQIPKLLPLIRAIIHLHNTRPRRSLGGLTPAQAYFHHRSRNWSRARRQQIFDWICAHAQTMVETKWEMSDHHARALAWRRSVVAWLRCQQLITVSRKPQPSPLFKTQIRS